MNARTTQRITADEAAWFRANWADTSNADIAEHFHRSRAWVATTARELDLPKKNTGRRSYGTSKWGPRRHELTPAEAEWIRDNWERCSMKEITQHLHISLPTLYDLVKPLDLPRKRRAKGSDTVTLEKPRRKNLRRRAASIYFASVPFSVADKFAALGIRAYTYAECMEFLAQHSIWVRVNTWFLSEPGRPRVFEWRIVRPDGRISGQGDAPLYPDFFTAMNAALAKAVNVLKEFYKPNN